MDASPSIITQKHHLLTIDRRYSGGVGDPYSIMFSFSLPWSNMLNLQCFLMRWILYPIYTDLPVFTPWAKCCRVRAEVPAGVCLKISGSRVCNILAYTEDKDILISYKVHLRSIKPSNEEDDIFWNGAN